MRLFVLSLLLFPGLLLAQETTRYGVALDAPAFPQATPQLTLASVLKAVEAKRVDYVVAQLSEATYIDERVKRLYAGKFEEQVADTAARLDPGAIKLLQKLARDGEWKIADTEAHLSAKAIENRSVYLKKVGSRWFLENKQSPCDMTNFIDLRSDTVTRPTPGMRAVMATAEVGDDVWNEDPTIHRLEARVAELLGKEAALFVPSGTMSNQIAIRIHTRPGDELLCDVNAHVYVYEAGGPAVLSGVTCHTLPGDSGILAPEQLRDHIRPINEHLVRTRLVCLENTHNRGGGRIYPLAWIQEISRWARAGGLAMHLDGARLWNAIVATGTPAATWADNFDTVSVCFSKGLGAPVGSALVGPTDLIARARYARKLFGGAMRQSGILAAAAIYALDHHVERLAEDHANARIIADAVEAVPGLELTPRQVDTNILWFKVEPRHGTPAEVAARFKDEGILVYPASRTQIRICTHLDVSRSQAEIVARAIRRLGGTTVSASAIST